MGVIKACCKKFESHCQEVGNLTLFKYPDILKKNFEGFKKMGKIILIIWLLLMLLNQLAGAIDIVLTAESDKPVYSVGDKANFTGRLKNISQHTYIEDEDVEYIFSVNQGELELWSWSRLDCG